MTLDELRKKEYLIDTHAHVVSEEYRGLEKSISDKALEAGIEEIFDVAINLATSKKSLEISRNNPKIRSFIGVDPEIFIPKSPFFEEDCSELWFRNTQKHLEELLTENSKYIVGIGESGLDFYWPKRQEATAEEVEKSTILQEKLYRMQLEIAQNNNLMLTIHSRGAEERCLEIAKEYSCRGIFHSYTGTYETAVKILDSGWGLGVNGIVTFKNAQDLREMYKKIIGKVVDPTPNDFYKMGIFFETDSPFLSPEGKRGEVNTPANVKIIFENFVKSLT